MTIKYYTSKETCERLGITRRTLQRWESIGKINAIRTAGNWRRYDLDGYLCLTRPEEKLKLCYCRVSSHDQREDLDKQIQYLKAKYPNHIIISDIGSGINFKRKGLLEIIDLAINNKIAELVITYKDRLCRIGYDLIHNLITKYSNAEIIIENDEEKNITKEITDDLIEIITVYSSKVYGSRSHKNK